MNIERIKNLLKSVATKPSLVWGKATPGTFYPVSESCPATHEDVARAIRDCTDLNRAIYEYCDDIAHVVLALFDGKTGQDVREEVALEHEEKMDRLLEGEWQAGYVAGNNDQLNGTICGRRRAANESIARGGER